MCLYRSGNNVDDIRKCDMTIQGESVLVYQQYQHFNCNVCNVYAIKQIINVSSQCAQCLFFVEVSILKSSNVDKIEIQGDSLGK